MIYQYFFPLLPFSVRGKCLSQIQTSYLWSKAISFRASSFLRAGGFLETSKPNAAKAGELHVSQINQSIRYREVSDVWKRWSFIDIFSRMSKHIVCCIVCCKVRVAKFSEAAKDLERHTMSTGATPAADEVKKHRWKRQGRYILSRSSWEDNTIRRLSIPQTLSKVEG